MIQTGQVGDPLELPEASGGIIGKKQKKQTGHRGRTGQGNPLDRVGGYEAERISMDPTTDTVEGRVEGILAKGSPLMRRAETMALQRMNRRGLRNSSMAIGAGQTAVLDAATPIAMQDARSALEVKGANQLAANRASEFGAGETNQALLAERGYQAQTSNIRDQGIQNRLTVREQGKQQRANIGATGRQTRWSQNNAAHQERLNLQETNQLAMERDAALHGQAIELADIDRRYQQLISTNQSAGLFYSQQATAISNILAQPDLTPEEKSALIRQQNQLLESGLTVLGSIANLDLTGLLDFSGGTGAGTPEETYGPQYDWTQNQPAV